MQQGGIPSDIETIPLPDAARSDKGIQLSKLLVAAGMAPSRTKADRLLKSGAVEINGAKWTELTHPTGSTLTIRAGKKWKRIEAEGRLSHGQEGNCAQNLARGEPNRPESRFH